MCTLHFVHIKSHIIPLVATPAFSLPPRDVTEERTKTLQQDDGSCGRAVGFAAGGSEVGTVCGGFPRADGSRPFPSRSRWKKLDLPSSPHAENLHIPPQRLGPPAKIKTPPDSPELHLHPQPRAAVCGNVKAAVRGEIQAAVRGSVKAAFSWEIQAAVCGEIQAAVRSSFKPTARGEIQADVCGEVKPAVRGEIPAAVRGQRKPAAVRGSFKAAVRGSPKPATVRGAVKAAVRGPRKPAAVHGPRKPAAVCGSPKPAIRKEI